MPVQLGVQVDVEKVFLLPGRGPIAVGILVRGKVSTGDSMLVRGTTTSVGIRGLELHVPQPRTGERIGLLLRDEDADRVTAGTVLVSPTD